MRQKKLTKVQMLTEIYENLDIWIKEGKMDKVRKTVELLSAHMPSKRMQDFMWDLQMIIEESDTDDKLE